MSTLSEIAAKIAATETKLSEAEVAKNEPLMLAYLNNLAELRHEKNQLTDAGKQSQPTPVSFSFAHLIAFLWLFVSLHS